MANTFTAPTWIKSKPHASAEKQVGDSDPSARTDVINRAEKGIYAVIRRIVNGLVDGVTLDFTDQATVTGIDGALLLVPRGYLSGLGLSNNATDPTNDIDIAAGIAADSTDAKTLRLTATLVKRLDAAWAVGTNQGGLDTGAIANTTYHVWLIKRSDTGVVDALFSTSASAPTMPTNYDYKRRIGSIIRAAGAIVLFQQDGDRFILDAGPVQEWSDTNPGTAAATKTLTRVPTGVRMRWLGGLYADAGGTAGTEAYVSDLSTDDVAVTASNAQVTTEVNGVASGQVQIMTNTSAQVRARLGTSNASTGFRGITFGWVDRRGRDD